MSNGSQTTPEQIARSIRERFEELLPAEETVREEEGWIDTRYSSFRIRTPRRRGNTVTAPFHKLFGTPHESFMVTERIGRLGKIPIIGARVEPKSAPQLKIIDRLYDPLDPVDGDTRTVRATQASFRTHLDRDLDDNGTKSGIEFSFLEVAVPNEVSMDFCRFSEPSGISFIGVDKFLLEHGLSVDVRTNDPLLLAQACIDSARHKTN